jgi:hypothetical protein
MHVHTPLARYCIDSMLTVCCGCLLCRVCRQQRELHRVGLLCAAEPTVLGISTELPCTQGSAERLLVTAHQTSERMLHEAQITVLS